MTNALAVCLLVAVFCCSSLTSARQIPKECAKGPGLWCQSLKQAAECGAVGHCIATVWVNQDQTIRKNDVSNKFVTLFNELKDINDLINEEYLGLRVKSACRSAPQAAYKLCKQNTGGFERYLSHVLASKTSPETICRIIGMCNNEKLDQALEKKTEPKKHKEHLLGAEQCTWGPSYWCSNFSTTRQCRATHHCIERVWSQMSFPEDKDDICKICTDMVTQARDQLQSNETQEELKEVFEGSCDLIPIKLVRKECKKLADDFVPELVETLASQMNPQAVCSVAGLCNNAKIDLMLDDYEKRDKRQQTGPGGGKKCKYDDIDELVLKMDGKDSTAIEGLCVPESSGTNQAQSHEPEPSEAIINTPIEQTPTQRPRAPRKIYQSTSINEANDSQAYYNELKTKIMEVELKMANEKFEIAKREKYKLDLEILKLERELNIQHPSNFTLPFYLQNVVIKPTSPIVVSSETNQTNGVDILEVAIKNSAH